MTAKEFEFNGLPTGLHIAEAIEEIGWDLPRLSRYCVSLRNYAFSQASAAAAIPQYVASGEIASWPAYLSEASASTIWLKLHEKALPVRYDPCDPVCVLNEPDPLSDSERKLYEALTAKFTLDASLGPVTVREIPNEEGGVA